MRDNDNWDRLWFFVGVFLHFSVGFLLGYLARESAYPMGSRSISESPNIIHTERWYVPAAGCHFESHRCKVWKDFDRAICKEWTKDPDSTKTLDWIIEHGYICVPRHDVY